MDVQEMTERIESFRELKQDWDSYGAVPIKANSIELALAVARSLPGDDWFVGPVNDGSVEFENNNATAFVRITTL